METAIIKQHTSEVNDAVDANETRGQKALHSETIHPTVANNGVNKWFPDRQALRDYDVESQSWKDAHAQCFRNHSQLAQVLDNVEVVDNRIYSLFETKITAYTAQLMDPEDRNCPIRLQYMPDNRELDIQPFEISDSLGEDHDMIPGTTVVHRYPNRVLFLSTVLCGSYCRYCTRKRFVNNNERSVTKAQIAAGVAYIASRPEINDVLISGGDPLLLADGPLENIIRAIREGCPNVKFLRIGSRLPVQLPTRITQEFCDMLERWDVQMLNIHVNHPKEITPILEQRLRMLRKAGVMLGNQSVLLKGVNDNVETMRELCLKLISIGVRPYYVYSCDQTEGNSHFYVTLEKMLEIQAGLRGHISGPAQPTFVVDGVGGLGKMPVQQTYVSRGADGKVHATNFEGRHAIQTNLG